jgi:short-subunit dehydrogenase
MTAMHPEPTGRNPKLHPETVLITGATGAIGSALALAYAAPGRVLVLHGRDAPRLDALARACEDRGARTETRAVDLRDTAALVAWLEGLASRRAVDLAIVNAGVMSSFHQESEGEGWQDIERVLDVNIRAALATVTALVPHMRRRGSGQIALMSSMSAYFGLPLAPAYSASKAALKAYGEALRGWLAPQHVQVNVVLPGFVKSPLTDRLSMPKPFLMSPEQAARRIQRGLARNQARICFPFPLALGCWMLAVLPPALSQRLLALLQYGGR